MQVFFFFYVLSEDIHVYHPWNLPWINNSLNNTCRISGGILDETALPVVHYKGTASSAAWVLLCGQVQSNYIIFFRLILKCFVCVSCDGI